MYRRYRHLLKGSGKILNSYFFLDLLNFVLCNVFTFGSLFFIQTCGLAMGTKLAPALATIVIADLEEEFLSPQPKQPVLWLRYSDDILLLWSHSNEDFTTFMQAINNIAPCIKFTQELSSVQSTFLDLTICKPHMFEIKGKLGTKIYYKLTNTFSYPYGNSSIHPDTLRDIAGGEYIRLLRCTSSEKIYQRYRKKLMI